MLVRRLLALTIALALTGLPASPAAGTADTGSEPTPRTTLGGEGTVLYFHRYVGEDDQYHYQLWALHGEEPTAVLTDPWFKPYAADLSPDGQQVAVTVGAGSTVTANAIYVMGIDGSARRNILKGNTKLTEARDPDWSPDGKRLVFVGLDRDFRYDLWTVRADGSRLTRLTACNCAWENTPKWSPDGAQVLWSPQTYDLAVLDVESGASRTVYDNAPSGHMNVQTADWSPDGETIAFSATPYQAAHQALHTIPVGGGVPTRLDLASNYSYANPTYSPEGERLGFTMYSASYDEYYSALAAVPPGGPFHTVTIHAPGIEQMASWAQDCGRCRPGGAFSSLSVHTRTMADAIEVSGGLLPGRYDQKIKVVIQKKPQQKWLPLQKTTVRTAPESIYFAAMKRAAGHLCRVTVTWAGDDKHRAARARTKPFSC